MGVPVFWRYCHCRGTESWPQLIWRLRTELSRALGRMLPASARALWPFFVRFSAPKPATSGIGDHGRSPSRGPRARRAREARPRGARAHAACRRGGRRIIAPRRGDDSVPLSRTRVPTRDPVDSVRAARQRAEGTDGAGGGARQVGWLGDRWHA
jgi:hypothetical protein